MARANAHHAGSGLGRTHRRLAPREKREPDDAEWRWKQRLRKAHRDPKKLYHSSELFTFSGPELTAAGSIPSTTNNGI